MLGKYFGTLKRSLIVGLTLLLLFLPAMSYAISKSALESLINNRPWYDPTQDCSINGTATSPGGAAGGIYILGDSITNQSKQSYESSLKTAGFTSVTVNGSDGRSIEIKGANPGTSGIEAVDADTASIRSASTVVVALGTNGGVTVDNIAQLISKIKSSNSSAKIFWVDTMVIGRASYAPTVNASNAAIYGSASGLGYEVISWAKKVTPSVNPSALSGREVDSNGYIRQADQFVHLNPAGVSALTNLVTDSVAATPSTQPITSADQDTKLARLIFGRAFSLSDITTLKSGKAGGIFARPNDKNDASFYNGLKQSLAGYTALVAVDFEGGRVQAPGDKLTGALPSAQKQGEQDEGQIKTAAAAMGRKLAAYGINMNFAPVIDIGGNNNAVIGDRAFANDVETVTKKAGSFASGMSDAGIVSVLKHFPGHGSKDGDSHSAPVATASLAELEARDIKPYQSLSKSAKTAIMMGHLRVPEWGNTATSLNPKAYEYVRLVLGFNGVVVTDALDMKGVSTPADEPSRARDAIIAGADMALVNSPTQFAPTLAKLKEAAQNGSLTQARIDEAATRIEALQKSADTTNSQVTPSNCAPCTPAGGATIPIDGENPKRLFEFLLGNGLSAPQAAGVTGAIMVESGPNIDPTIRGGGGNNYMGIAQWDIPGRWASLVRWARENGKNELAFETQVEYMWKEASERKNGPNGETNIEGVMQQPTLELAAWYWGRFFEVAILGGSTSTTPMENVQSLEKRITYGSSVLIQYGGSTSDTAGTPTSGGGSCSNINVSSGATVVGNLAWPLPFSFWESNQEWFTKPHHDYPAADIPVPRGTPVYSMTGGTATFSGGACGEGVTVTTGGARFNYCHGITGSRKVTDGQTVSPGQHLFDVNSTGRSTGDHLHLGIKVDGIGHCPQELFKKMAANETNIDLATLPTSGCSY